MKRTQMKDTTGMCKSLPLKKRVWAVWGEPVNNTDCAHSSSGNLDVGNGASRHKPTPPTIPTLSHLHRALGMAEML